MNDKSTEHFKQKDELIPYGVESDQPLQTFMSLEESVMFEDDIQKTIIEAEPDLLEKIKTQIENNIRDLKTVVDTMNKLREEAAKLESDLVSLIDCSTWQNISEFIGISSTNIDECMKTFD